ncbi:MAG TPA: translation initiation factor [Opitutaceae bacterium]
MGQNPFAALGSAGLPSAPPAGSAASDKQATTPPRAPAGAVKNRGRVDIVRTTAGRGGKTVTVVQGFVGIGLPEKEQLAKKMQKACGCGGTVKDGKIEIQGDKREEVARILIEAGFRPVLAGG